VTGFPGANGAGKTTAVRILATLLRADELLAWFDLTEAANRVAKNYSGWHAAPP
jgi:ABC-type Na+ transport system ATPase subunit NatA